jgi:hypothetical protein
MIEVDEEIRYPKGYSAIIEGQAENTVGLPLFDNAGNGIPTTQPTRIEYDGVTNRPYTAKNRPIYEAPTVPGGARKTEYIDIPIKSHPFSWSVSDVAKVKYESILAKNYPWQVVIGEEFITDDHIDSGNSSGVTITEGKLNIAPDGVFQSTEFKFLVTSNGVIDPLADTTGNDSKTFVFDTFFVDIDPAPFESIEVEWQGRKWSDNTWTAAWEKVILDEEWPTTETAQTTATKLKGIRFKIQNDGVEPFSIENYTVFLRVRNLPTV